MSVPRTLLRWAARSGPLYSALTALFGRRVAVDGASMYPLLVPGDRVLVDRLAYVLARPQRGDVVLLELPYPQAQLQMKAVVGLPGEEVEVRKDALWVDGERLRLPQPVVGSLPGRWQLGPDEYFVVSLATPIGTDSRHYGPVPRAAIRGRASLIYWPRARRATVGRLWQDEDPYVGRG